MTDIDRCKNMKIYDIAYEMNYIWKCFEYGMADARVWARNDTDNINGPTGNEIHNYFITMANKITDLNRSLFELCPNIAEINAIKKEIRADQHKNNKWTDLLNYTIRGYCIPNNLKHTSTLNFEINKIAVYVLDDIIINDSILTTISLGFNHVYGGETHSHQLETLKATIDTIKERYTSSMHETNICLQQGIKPLTFDTPHRLIDTRSSDTRIKAHLRRCLYITRKFLKDNPHVMVTNADKGKAMIIMKKQTYNQKIEAYIENEISKNAYLVIAKENQHDILKTIMDELHKKYILTKREYNQWTMDTKNIYNISYKTLPQDNSSINLIPALYVQIKIHNPNLAVRPIVANPQDSLAELQITLIQFLKKYIKPQYDFIITNSLDVVNSLEKLRNERGGRILNEGHRIASIDFEAMYTNVPTKEIYRIISEDFDECIKNSNPEISLEIILNWTKTCIEDFAYIATPIHKFRLIKQNKGIAMGNKLSYILSEIVTAKSISKIINEIPIKEISFVYKYVDDLLIGFNYEKANLIKSKFKEHLPDMPITIEYENEVNHSIKYLDMEISRKGRNIKYSWLRKSYMSDKIINNYSGHPWKQKYSIYLNIANKALSITNHKYLLTAIRFIKLMKRNAYSLNTIKQILATTIDKLNLTKKFPITFQDWLTNMKPNQEHEKRETSTDSILFSNSENDSDAEIKETNLSKKSSNHREIKTNISEQLSDPNDDQILSDIEMNMQPNDQDADIENGDGTNDKRENKNTKEPEKEGLDKESGIEDTAMKNEVNIKHKDAHKAGSGIDPIEMYKQFEAKTNQLLLEIKANLAKEKLDRNKNENEKELKEGAECQLNTITERKKITNNKANMETNLQNERQIIETKTENELDEANKKWNDYIDRKKIKNDNPFMNQQKKANEAFKNRNHKRQQQAPQKYPYRHEDRQKQSEQHQHEHITNRQRQLPKNTNQHRNLYNWTKPDASDNHRHTKTEEHRNQQFFHDHRTYNQKRPYNAHRDRDTAHRKYDTPKYNKTKEYDNYRNANSSSSNRNGNTQHNERNYNTRREYNKNKADSRNTKHRHEDVQQFEGSRNRKRSRSPTADRPNHANKRNKSEAKNLRKEKEIEQHNSTKRNISCAGHACCRHEISEHHRQPVQRPYQYQDRQVIQVPIDFLNMNAAQNQGNFANNIIPTMRQYVSTPYIEQ